MAVQHWGVDLSFIAAVDLSAYQWYLVKTGSIAGEVTPVVTAGGSALGVLQNDPRAGEEATVRVLGTTIVRATAEASNASPVVWGGLIKASSTGMVCGNLNSAASAYCVGFALEAMATGSGTYIEAYISPFAVRT